MGGKAIKSAKRFPDHKFITIVNDVFDVITHKLGHEHTIAYIPYYRNKRDHGDLDILITSDNLPSDWVNELKEGFNSKEIFKNGSVCSFEFDEIQVDIITISSKYFYFAYHYYAFNDLGNLIGRIAHRYGFKFGHKGLLYPFREGTHLYKELELTTDFKTAIEFLGFDSERYYKGFDDLEDIYQFVADSKYFKKDMFPLEHRSHRARVRDEKRGTYTGFLKWIQDNQPEDGEEFQDPLQSAFEQFPVFDIDFIFTLFEIEEQKILKQKFNGDIVREITGLEGKELGKFMQHLKKVNNIERFKELSESTIKNIILFNFINYSI